MNSKNGVSYLYLSCVCLMAIFSSIMIGERPIFSPDESRYLSVAWEMFLNKSYLVLTKNGDFYSHKPPLLFWLINFLWEIFGVSERAAQTLVLFFYPAYALIMFKTFKRLGAKDSQNAAVFYLCLFSIPVLAMSPLIMFDGLQAFLTACALYYLVKSKEKRENYKWLLVTGFFLGLSLLTKGPVAYLHLLAPVLTAPFWSSQKLNKKSWYLYSLAAFTLGTLMLGAWALTAAKLGGEAFANELLWKQTAGRVVKSFAHSRPFYFYIWLIPVVLAPYTLSLSWWKGLLAFKKRQADESLKFAAFSVVPTVFLFSFVSAKQMHYVMAEFYFMFFMAQSLLRDKKSFGSLYTGLVFLGVLAVSLISLGVIPVDLKVDLQPLNPWLLVLSLVLFFAFGLWSLLERKKRETYLKIAALNLLFFIFIFVNFGPLIKDHSLVPVADQIRKGGYTQIAARIKNHGQFNFLSRLKTKVVRVNNESEALAWLKQNPEAAVVLKHKEKLSTPEGIESKQYKYKSSYLTLWSLEK